MISLRDDSDSTGPKPSAVAEELVEPIFSEGGWLLEKGDLDYRPQQERMARAVAAALGDDESLLFEAGTGVGKSLAYLLPGILRAVDDSRQMIVSTRTITLQEQIELNDLPLCRRFLESRPELARYAGFRSALLVGKANYLCPTRLAHALTERASLFADADYDELQRIAEWAGRTVAGLRHELSPAPRSEVWEAVNADSSACSRKHCDCNRCFYQLARGRLRSAQVIIVNHSLLFALINAGGGAAGGGSGERRGVLFPNDFLVLDEAHTVPEVATENFGLSLSSYGIERVLKHLYNPRSRRGVLRSMAEAAGLQQVVDAIEVSRQFFQSIATRLFERQSIVRVREPGVAEPLLDGPLDAVARLLARLADRLEDGPRRDELLEQRLRIRSIQASLANWLTLGDKGHVYWAEQGGRRRNHISLRSAPIDVAPALRRHVFGCGTSVICTSATLALGGSIEPFAQRIGAEAARREAVDSPFNYREHMRVYVAADLPQPEASRGVGLAHDALADYIAFCVGRVAGGSLALFTSYADMLAVAGRLEAQWREEDRPFLMQGPDQSRTELAQQMRTLGRAVLFGTDSFWTGIDVPGPALSQVIITRLPFDPPTHPITEARLDWIREQGGNPFQQLTLPEALIRFRQGVGRLIRTQTDRGLVTLLDPRVLSRTYGRLFLESLPQPEFVRLTRETRTETFHPFA